jgi:lipopolysaccharide transport system ATP-binding protein
VSDTLVKVDNVSKKFCRDLKRGLWYGLKDLGAELTGKSKELGELREKEFWAVRDVDFELKRGDCLGLIGRNGAGKSTLLKMLNGLIKPDRGRIELRGRVGALIELGAGFNPVLTGRENIYINGAVLGFSKADIDRKFDSIAAFADIDDFLDTPVQYYSSGMKVRLGFAVASQMEPDILLIDEVLAVGDAGFKVKCYNEIFRMMKRSAMIFVSHSMPQVGKICTQAMIMTGGECRLLSSDIPRVIAGYYDEFGGGAACVEGSGRARVHRLTFENGALPAAFEVDSLTSRRETIQVRNDAPIRVAMEMEIDPGVRKFSVRLAITDMEQQAISQAVSQPQGFDNSDGIVVVRAEIPSLMLSAGSFLLNIWVHETRDAGLPGEHLVWIRNAVKFSVTGTGYSGAAPITYSGVWSLS